MIADTGKWKAKRDWWADEQFYPGVIHSRVFFFGANPYGKARAHLYAFVFPGLQ